MAGVGCLVLVGGCGRTELGGPVNPDAIEDTPKAALGSLPESVSAAETATSLPATPTPVPVPTQVTPPPSPVALPAGFTASVYAANLKGVRFMAVADNGDVFASVPSQDRIVVLPDRNADGIADRVIVFAEGEGLNQPHGLAFRGNWLYVANTDGVVRYEAVTGEVVARGTPEAVIPNLPGDGTHWTRSLEWGADERLYVSIGSSCDVCIEEHPLRASILRALPDGSELAIFARGLRNAVGLAFNPSSGELWATENGRDLLGDELPPDEVNRIGAGLDYGWPFCFGSGVPDPELAAGADPLVCSGTQPATIPLQAHSAPLGLTFYDGAMFPEEMHGDLFVAYHGSRPPAFPTGYKVVRIPFDGADPAGSPEDFATGWLLPDTARWGRPVDVVVAADGSLLVSDDAGGRIYRIFYATIPPTPTPFH